VCFQVGFGSGFKSNSAVWKALRNIKEPNHKAWAHVTLDDVAGMWSDLELMGIRCTPARRHTGAKRVQNIFVCKRRGVILEVGEGEEEGGGAGVVLHSDKGHCIR